MMVRLLVTITKKSMSIRLVAISTAFFFAFVLFLGGIAVAQEASVGADASAEVSTEVKSERSKTGAFQFIKNVRANLQGKRDVIKEAREEEKDIRQDVRSTIKAEANVDVRREMKDAEKERRADVREEKKEQREEIKEKREEARGGLRARVHNLLRAHLGAIVNRLTVSLRYFDNMVKRMESRIQKLKDRGVDTTSVEASLATAVNLIATAKTDVKAITDAVDAVADTSDSAALKEELREAITKATASVKAAHRALVDTAHALIALVRVSAEADANVDADVDADN